MKLIPLIAIVAVLPRLAQGQATLALSDAPAAASAPANTAGLDQKTADALWAHLNEVREAPVAPPGQAPDRSASAARLYRIAEAAAEFRSRFPADPRVWQACLYQIQASGAITRLSGNPSDAAEKSQFQAIIANSRCPHSIRGQAQYALLALAMYDYQRGDPSLTAASITGQFNEFVTTYPGVVDSNALRVSVAQALEQRAPDDAAALLRQAADSPQSAATDTANKELAKLEKLRTPFQLQFTAADGTPVDLAKMKGQVVLIDFWATWCGPCRREIPNVVAAYKKYHDQGFDVIGISLDQDKNKLLDFTAQNGMPWPQYFDGKGWSNEIAVANGIRAIPAMWLVNKKGVVVNQNARDVLESEIPTLLAESSN